MMKKFLKRFGLFLVLLIGLATLISEGSLYFLRNSSFYKPSYVVNSLNRAKYDYVVLGSSVGLTTLNTVAIDSLTGLHGVNLSMDDTGIGAHYLMLEHFLAQGKTTKYCVLSTSAVSLNAKNPGMSTNDYRFLPFIRKPYVASYFNELEYTESKLIHVSKLLSFVGVSYYNAEIFYPSLISVVKPKRHNRFDAYGNYQYPVKSYDKSTPISFINKKISLQNPYLNRLKRLCEQHGIELLVYLPPNGGNKAVVAQSGYSTINHSDLLKDISLFYDKLHVNSKGRKLASCQFSKDFFLEVNGEL